ncbi:MAG: CocE/NonD family hydrolase C-terminal non-catalytic domain-containing protein [Limisphaerales bacterium]
MTPGVVYQIPVQIQDLAYTFRREHRLRLVISSADYPMYDRNLNDGGPMYTNGTPLVATNRIYHDAVNFRDWISKSCRTISTMTACRTCGRRIILERSCATARAISTATVFPT